MTDACIFCNIVSGKIPAETVYESEDFIAIKDISPQANSHILVIPKHHIDSLADAKSDDEKDCLVLSNYLGVISEVAEQIGLTNTGFRTVFNTNKNACQTVFHIHAHIIGGNQLNGKMA